MAKGLVGSIVDAGVGLVKDLTTSNKDKSQDKDTSSQQDEDSLRPRRDSRDIRSSRDFNRSSRDFRRSSRDHGRSVDLNRETAHRDSQDYRDDESDFDSENDEEDWDLDDAQQEISDPHELIGKNEDSQVTVRRIVLDFVLNHPAPKEWTTTGDLPYPVIIPQRRPHSQKRGFIRAYAPDLRDCSIDQDTFLDFIVALNRASEASSIFDVVNIGTMAVGLVPSAIAAIVSAAIGAANQAKSASAKRQTNNFLEEMNEDLFKPHGLFCLIMTYKPGSKIESRARDISTSVFLATPPNAAKTGSRKSISGGRPLGLPEVAPLVFPILDQAAASGNVSEFKGHYSTVGEYIDRRAQAKYNQNVSSSHMTEIPESASRPGNSTQANQHGGLVSEAPGGKVKLGGKGGRRGSRRTGGRRGKGVEGREDHDAIGGVKRQIREDVLYLMIVNMPSEAELAEHMRASGSRRGSSAQSLPKLPEDSSTSSLPERFQIRKFSTDQGRGFENGTSQIFNSQWSINGNK